MFFYLRCLICLVAFGAMLPCAVWADSLHRQDAVQMALDKNLEVRSAKSALKATRAQALQSWALPDPELEVEWEGMNQVLGFGNFEERQVGITQQLTFPVTWWMRGQVGQKQVQVARLNVYETVRQDVALRVHLAYDRVLANEQLVTFAKTHVALAQELVARAKTRFAAGDVPQLDVMQTEVLLGRQENQLMAAQNRLVVSKSNLNVLLNQAVDAPVVLVDSLFFEPFDKTLASLEAKSVRRPEYMGATQAYDVAKKMRSLATLSLLPDVSVGVFRQTVAQPTGHQKFWRTGIAVELPVWSFLRQRGEISEANAERAHAEAVRDQVLQRISQEVQVAYAQVQTTTKRATRMQDRILPTAKAAYDIARRSYDEGKASYLDLIAAQRGWVETQSEYVETLYEYRAALAMLMYATGDGLITEEITQ